MAVVWNKYRISVCRVEPTYMILCKDDGKLKSEPSCSFLASLSLRLRIFAPSSPSTVNQTTTTRNNGGLTSSNPTQYAARDHSYGSKDRRSDAPRRIHINEHARAGPMSQQQRTRKRLPRLGQRTRVCIEMRTPSPFPAAPFPTLTFVVKCSIRFGRARTGQQKQS